MELLDIRTNGDDIYNPIERVGDKIICEKIKKVGRKFSDHRVFGYYRYNLKSKKLKKISKHNENLYKGVVHNKYIEGENCVYYVTRERGIDEDLYELYKINLYGEEKEHLIMEFSIDNKYSDIMIECISDDYVCVFAKKSTVFDFEMKLELKEEQYGCDVGYMFQISTGQRYEIKDNYFLRSVTNVFFTAKLNNEVCVIYEENYLGENEKEDLYKSLKKDEENDEREMFYYKDSVKYMPLNKFIEDIKNEESSLDFMEIVSVGYEGYEIFSGVCRDNIYFLLKDFEIPNEEKIMILDRNTMKKTVYTIAITEPSMVEPRNSFMTDYIRIFYSLNLKNKGVFATKYLGDGTLRVKELIDGDMEFVYPEKLGFVKEQIKNRYLIAFNDFGWNKEYTSVIDIEKNKVKRYKGYFQVFDDDVVLF